MQGPALFVNQLYIHCMFVSHFVNIPEWSERHCRSIDHKMPELPVDRHQGQLRPIWQSSESAAPGSMPQFKPGLGGF